MLARQLVSPLRRINNRNCHWRSIVPSGPSNDLIPFVNSPDITVYIADWTRTNGAIRITSSIGVPNLSQASIQLVAVSCKA